MSAEMQQMVLGALHEIGGATSANEIARRINRPESEVVDALCELEQRGLATPAAWTQGPEPMPTLPLR